MIWPFISAACALVAFYCAYRWGESVGRDNERERCLSLCHAATIETNRLSPSLRRVQHAIMNGLGRPLTEDEFFGQVKRS